MAIDIGPPATQEEIDLVFDLIIQKAMLTNAKQVFLSYEEIAPCLVGDTAWEKDPTEELIKRRDDRVKLRLYKGLVKKGLKSYSKNPSGANGYEFFLGDNVEISINNSKSDSIQAMNDRIQTTTTFGTKFIPPTWFPDLVSDMRVRLNIAISGPKGCGKDRCVEEAAAFLGLKSIRIAMGSISDPSILFGTKEIVSENGVPITKFVPGLLTYAAMHGQVAVLDEFDSVQPSITLALNNILDSKMDIVVQTELGPEIIKKHPNFIVVASANTTGHGEGGMLYSGTEIVNKSTWDRFTSVYRVDYDNALEAKLVSQWLHKNVVDMLYHPQNGIIVKIREAIKNGDIMDHLSYRSIEAFATNYNRRGWHKGWYHYILNKINPQHIEQIIQIIRLQAGKEFVPSLNDFNPSDQTTYIPSLQAQIRGKRQYFGFINEPDLHPTKTAEVGA